MNVTINDTEKGMKMMGNPTDEKQLEKELRKRRRNRYMMLSTWGTTLAAFVGFFTIWNHVASGSTHSTTQSAVSASSNTFSSSTRTHHHDDFDGGNGGFSDDRSFSQSGSGSGSAGSGNSFNGNQGGSVNVNPRQTPSFTSRAS